MVCGDTVVLKFGVLLALLVLCWAQDDGRLPCEELNAWLKDNSVNGGHGAALSYIEESCDTIKVVQNAAEKLQKHLNISMHASDIIKFLRYTKPGRPDDKFLLNIHYIRLREFFIYENTMTATMVGDLKESWEDFRFSWDRSLGLSRHSDKVSIHGFATMWLPDIIIHGSNAHWKPSNPWASGGTGALTSKTSTMQGGVQPTLYRNGTIAKGISFNGQGNCSFDFTNYPNDEHMCCLGLRSAEYGEQFRFNIWNHQLNLEVASVSEEWKFKSGHASTYIDEDKVRVLNLCATFQRNSASIYATTILPLAAVLVMVIMVPIFTGWKLQIYVKVFALLLLFLNLMAMIRHIGDKIGFAGDVPVIIRVYDFVIWLTVISLVVTVVVWSLSRREYALPPPHNILMIADRVNGLCWCTSSGTTNIQGREEQHQQSELTNGDVHMNGNSHPEEGTTKPTPGAANHHRSYRNEWEAVYRAGHNIFTALVTVLYIIGVIVVVS